jgi:hypothetical protein
MKKSAKKSKKESKTPEKPSGEEELMPSNEKVRLQTLFSFSTFFLVTQNPISFRISTNQSSKKSSKKEKKRKSKD